MAKPQFQQFSLEEKIGRGPMGEVFLGRNLFTGDRVAVKILNLPESGTGKEIQAFKTLQESLNFLNLKEVLRFHTLMFENGKTGLVTDFFDGFNLKECKNSLSLKEKIMIFKKCVETLKSLHEHQIFHHNLKPENILLNLNQPENPEIRICDAGLLNLWDIHELFRQNDAFKVFRYLSPEQTGIIRIKPDARSDLYSLGISFDEFFDKSSPLKSENSKKAPDSLREKLSEILSKLIAKDPKDRYQSAQGLLFDLELLSHNREDWRFKIGSRDTGYQESEISGRIEEQLILKDRYEKMCKDFPQMVFIQGKTGMGKTRLIQEFLSSLNQDPDLLISVFQASEFLKNTPFSPFSYWFEESAFLLNQCSKQKNRKLKPRLIHGLIKIFPVLKEFLKPLKKEREKEFFQMGEAVMELLECLALQKKLIFIAENAQDLDQDSMDLLELLSRKMSSGRVMLILACNDDSPEPAFDRLKGSPMMTRMILNPLSEPETRQMVQRILKQDTGLPEKFYSQIFEHSLGFPLMIHEIIGNLKNQGILKKENQFFRLSSDFLEIFQFAPSLEKFLENKLDSFSEKELKILSAAAVIPKEFNLYFIKELIPLSEEEILAAFQKALKLFLIRPQLAGYAFAHKKIQDAVLKRIPENTLIQHHLTLARQIARKETLRDEDIFQLAYHYGQTREDDQTLYYSDLACEKAEARYAFKEKIHYLEKMLIIRMNRHPWPPETMNNLENLARLLQMNNRIDESFFWIKQAMDYCESAELEEEKIELELLKASGYYYANQRENSLVCFHNALSLSEKLKKEITNGFAYRLLGGIYWFNFDLIKAEEALSKALKHLNPEDYENRLISYCLRGWTYTLQGELKKAFQDIKAVEKNLSKVQNPLILAQIYHSCSIVYSWGAGEYSKAFEYSGKSYSISENAEYYIFQYSSLFSKGLASFYQRHFSESKDIFKAGLDLADRYHIRIGIGICQAMLSESMLWKGEILEAHEISSHYLKNREQVQEKLASLIFLKVEAVYDFLKGRTHQALARVQEGIEGAEETGILFLKLFFLLFKMKIHEELDQEKDKKETQQALQKILNQNSDFLKLYQRELSFFDFFNDLKTSFQASKKITLREKIQIENIIQTSQMISSILDTDDLLKAILEKTLEATGAEQGCLFLTLQEKGRLSLKKAIEISSGMKGEIKPPEDMLNQVMATGRGAFFSDEGAKKSGLRSALCSPLIFNQELKGVLYLESFLLSGLFSEEEMKILGVFTSQAAISLVNAEKNRIIQRQFSDSIQIISELVASSSEKLHSFIEQVTEICVKICKKLGLSSEETEKIRIASRLHDLGMMGIPAKLHYGFYPLKPEEWETLYRHPARSVEIVEHLYGIDEIRQMILQHEERFQGQGYPQKLKGDEIVMGARIIGLADDFIEMLSRRQYQKTNKKEMILKELQTLRGVYYDPRATDALIRLIEEEELIYTVKESDIQVYRHGGKTVFESPSHLNFESLVVGMVMDEVSLLDLDSELVFSIDYSLCEVFRNAVIHGNRYQENKKVTLGFQAEEAFDGQKKLIFQVTDEGEGMNIEEHNRFAESRKEIFSLISRLKQLQQERGLENDAEISGILKEADSFKEKYYGDFNAYRKLQGPDLSGGLGLIYVKKTFDSVTFENLIRGNRVCGTRVTLEIQV
jgi:HD-GYP domain-containing protein (c-di-GMP phosphodiesterase class II)/serine/threonine protein kinase/anti-sigma regulatory factor (Ser/Thr protein kinase)